MDGRIASMQRRSFWQSVDLWMDDLHQELESRNRTTTTTTGSHITEEGSSYELEVIHTPVNSRCAFITFSIIRQTDFIRPAECLSLDYAAL